MRAIIPVAGFGTRLRPHTFTIPKVLLNVGGKPILGHILDKLTDDNIQKATFVVGYLGDVIENYVKTNYPEISSDFVFQEEMLGLGHAIYTAVPTFGDDDIFIILGDTIFDVDMTEVFGLKKNSLGVKVVEDPRRFGVAVTDDNGIITKLIEKPDNPVSKLALVGLYYIKNGKLLKESLEELINNNIKTRNEYQLTDALQIMIDKGEVISTFPVGGWYDCGKPETLLSTNKFLLDRNGTKHNTEGCIIIEPVYIAEDAEVKNSIIGPYATISSKSRIENCIIKNSIINQRAEIKNAMLNSSIIGNNAAVSGSFRKLNVSDSSEIEF